MNYQWKEHVANPPPRSVVLTAPKGGGKYIQLPALCAMADRLWGPGSWRIEYGIPEVVSDDQRSTSKGGTVRVVTARCNATVIVDAESANEDGEIVSEQIIRQGAGADSAMAPVGPDDGTAVENALKSAATSAAKRAFAGIGPCFGRDL